MANRKLKVNHCAWLHTAKSCVLEEGGELSCGGRWELFSGGGHRYVALYDIQRVQEPPWQISDSREMYGKLLETEIGRCPLKERQESAFVCHLVL